MRQGFFGVIRGREKSVKRMGLYWVKVEMPTAFGRLSLVRYAHNATVTCVPLLRIGTARPPPFGRRGRDRVKRHIFDVGSVVGVRSMSID